MFRIPLLLGYLIAGRRDLIDADVARWVAKEGLPTTRPLLRLLGRREFRTLYYHRLQHGGKAGHAFQKIARLLYRTQIALYLETVDIGPGFYIQHGFATIIAARKIGANCRVNQQVTIGYTSVDDAPTLEDDVSVYAGAIVVGDVTLHEGCRVAAGAVVVRDVPAGALAIGVPAHHSASSPSMRELAHST